MGLMRTSQPETSSQDDLCESNMSGLSNPSGDEIELGLGEVEHAYLDIRARQELGMLQAMGICLLACWSMRMKSVCGIQGVASTADSR